MSEPEEDLGAGCTDEMPLDLKPGTIGPGDEACYFKVWDGRQWVVTGQCSLAASDEEPWENEAQR